MLYILLLLTITQIQIFCQTTSPKREFRGVWIASVENMDWPSNKHLSSDEQKKEFIRIINRFKKDKINSVFMQIRPSCDAFYQSNYEPWSEWLTGKQGKPPDPYYDPLKFIVEECHKRGIEVHAWFNPFRSVVNIKTSDVSQNHISKTHPDWNIQYDQYKWLNPGLPAVRNYVIKIILDVVKRYDIDGVHMDDYFYPYPVKNKVFHDEKTFKGYSRGFNNLDLWRRDNINIFLKQMSDSIRKTRPGCIFGISPFGIWKNKSTDVSGSETNGSESYFDTYSDSKKWISEGWVDYLVPQVYWNIGNKLADYKTLAEWWNRNSFGKNIYIGQAIYKIAKDKNPEWMEKDQIPRQIRLNRSLNNISGNVFFNATTFLKNPLGLEDSLINNYYKYYALTPVIKRKGDITPSAPANGSYYISNGRITLNWNKPLSHNGDSAIYYVIYKFPKDESVNISNPERIADIVYGTETNWTDSLFSNNPASIYVITSLNFYKEESKDNCRIIIPSVYPILSSETQYVYSNPNSLKVIRQDNIVKLIINMDKLGLITIKIYDFYGREIRQLLNEYRSSGQFEIKFDEKDIHSKSYLIQMKTNGYISSKRIIISGKSF